MANDNLRQLAYMMERQNLKDKEDLNKSNFSINDIMNINAKKDALLLDNYTSALKEYEEIGGQATGIGWDRKGSEQKKYWLNRLNKDRKEEGAELFNDLVFKKGVEDNIDTEKNEYVKEGFYGVNKKGKSEFANFRSPENTFKDKFSGGAVFKALDIFEQQSSDPNAKTKVNALKESFKARVGFDEERLKTLSKIATVDENNPEQGKDLSNMITDAYKNNFMSIEDANALIDKSNIAIDQDKDNKATTRVLKELIKLNKSKQGGITQEDRELAKLSLMTETNNEKSVGYFDEALNNIFGSAKDQATFETNRIKAESEIVEQTLKNKGKANAKRLGGFNAERQNLLESTTSAEGKRMGPISAVISRNEGFSKYNETAEGSVNTNQYSEILIKEMANVFDLSSLFSYGAKEHLDTVVGDKADSPTRAEILKDPAHPLFKPTYEGFKNKTLAAIEDSITKKGIGVLNYKEAGAKALQVTFNIIDETFNYGIDLVSTGHEDYLTDPEFDRFVKSYLEEEGDIINLTSDDVIPAGNTGTVYQKGMNRK